LGQDLQEVVENWRIDYNQYRPHSSLGGKTPAGFAAELCATHRVHQLERTTNQSEKLH